MHTLVLFVSLAAAAQAPPGHDARTDRLIEQVAAGWDSARGGFVTRDGAPMESAVELAFALGRERGEPRWTARARQTVRWTLGLYDSTGGGFFSRTRDADRMSSSFEKWTEPNARRLENLIDAWHAGGGAVDREAVADRGVATRVVDYFERVLMDPRGGFVAGQSGDRDLQPRANGFAIHAWLAWAAATSDPRVRDFALKSLDRVWTSSWNPDFGLLRRDPFGELRSAPQLEDQTEMGRALVLAAHLGGRAADLARAKTLGEMLLARYEDPQKGGFASQASPKQGKVKRSGRDAGENARAARFLAELASVTGERKYREAALRASRAFARDLEKASGEPAAEWALALRAIAAPDLPRRPVWQAAEPPTKPPAPHRARTKPRKR
jgi:uncharacterized protein YyaL (SSP411 family)